MRTLFDTSVPAPALADQLGNHEAALDALHRYTHGGHEGCCSAHALAECYATLTALPLPTRIMPEEARADQILTYNVSHFERFQLPGMTVAVP